MRLPSDIIKRTHQFWSAASHILGKETITKTYQVVPRQVQRWSADPDHADQTSRNPIDLLLIVMTRLLEMGRVDIVEGGLRRLVEPLGYSIRANHATTDQGSIALELLDVSRCAGNIADCYLEANRDRKITPDDQAELLARADEMIRQVEELKDAIHHGKEVSGGIR